MERFIVFDCLLGQLFIVSNGNYIVRLCLGEEDFENWKGERRIEGKEDDLLREATRQLGEYFRRERKIFQLPFVMDGTDFQKKVWEALLQIPYGETKTYQQIATEIGNPKAVRAVGQANKANTLPILIPCHRVIGKNGDLLGYAGTRTDLKKQLLQIEGSL